LHLKQEEVGMFVLVHEEDALHCAALALPLVLLLHPRESSLHGRVLRRRKKDSLYYQRDERRRNTCAAAIQRNIHALIRWGGRVVFF
jgi:hypothetical protein